MVGPPLPGPQARVASLWKEIFLLPRRACDIRLPGMMVRYIFIYNDEKSTILQCREAKARKSNAPTRFTSASIELIIWETPIEINLTFEKLKKTI